MLALLPPKKSSFVAVLEELAVNMKKLLKVVFSCSIFSLLGYSRYIAIPN